MGYWIQNKMWYTYAMEYYSAVIKDKMLPLMTTWINLENIMLSKIMQTEKVEKHTISLTYEM